MENGWKYYKHILTLVKHLVLTIRNLEKKLECIIKYLQTTAMKYTVQNLLLSVQEDLALQGFSNTVRDKNVSFLMS